MGVDPAGESGAGSVKWTLGFARGAEIGMREIVAGCGGGSLLVETRDGVARLSADDGDVVWHTHAPGMASILMTTCAGGTTGSVCV